MAACTDFVVERAIHFILLCPKDRGKVICHNDGERRECYRVRTRGITVSESRRVRWKSFVPEKLE